ncbi:MAG TPA: rhomboid family intramembrane serine protease [Candidatus Limnocylindrales bacterium]|nr:rhomboid family intramembrane serine protease [Candidatus Limnocylindrales bacterium]
MSNPTARTVLRAGLKTHQAQQAVILLLAMGLDAQARNQPPLGWEVSVPEEQAERAEALLREKEPERPAPPPAPTLFPHGAWSGKAAYAAAGLGALCVAIHLYVHEGVGPSPRSRMIEAGAVVPYLVAQGEWWRLLSAVFLHFDIRHLVSNMSALAILGPPLAAELGVGRFLAAFVISGVAGNVLSQLLNASAAVKAGASGGVCGILGALAGTALPYAAGTYEQRRPAWQTLGALAALFGMMVGFEPGRDHYAHVGGVLAGVVLGRWLRPANSRILPVPDQDAG